MPNSHSATPPESLPTAPQSLEAVLAKLRRSTELACGYPDVTIGRAEAHLLLNHVAERERIARLLEGARDDWYKREKKLKEDLRDLRAIVRERSNTRENYKKAKG